MDDSVSLILVVIVGFGAQMVDGSLGMGYGVISNGFLLILGIPPALASSSVHVSKMFTNGASGLSHVRFGNVERAVVKKLVPAGVVGGVLGALAISALPHGVARPFVAVYLFVTGMVILRKALLSQSVPTRSAKRNLIRLGTLGGFLDAIGGGGWGPVVTSTLLAGGDDPRRAIGSANLAEFFVAVAISLAFSTRLTLMEQAQLTLALIVGGVVAAPLAAYLSGRLPPRITRLAVGVLILIVSVALL